MAEDRDLYPIFQAGKLWALLPEVYRAEDTDKFDRNGPLRELVNRIGTQAAILRRSIDRLWEDQSIETCDDWVIPYIGDLLATNLVAGLATRDQRLDVANTIYYRRRKGTLAVLEEIAANITGWDAKLVEFFRRLGRTRHGLDPEIGLPASPGDPIDQLRQAQGLVGPLTRTGAGGFADLRSTYGAIGSRSAFDEFSHTADLRAGRGAVGWYNIPSLGVFLWRLDSFGGPQTTPVAVLGRPHEYTFDPTGRDVPLFARAARPSSHLAQDWVSAAEWQLPGPISQPLFDADVTPSAAQPVPPFNLYPGSVAAYGADGGLLPVAGLSVETVRGRLCVTGSPPAQVVTVGYYYGFASMIGAGPYDRRVVGGTPVATPAPVVTLAVGAPIPPLPPQGTLRIADSLTRNTVPDGVGVLNLTLQAGVRERPLIRFGSAPASPPSSPPGQGEAGAWVIAGQSGAQLTLDGLFISGGDVVLTGAFQSVTLNCCTLDPGSAGSTQQPPTVFTLAADGRALAPVRLWIEASIATLIVARCVTGPIRTRVGGAVETLTASDSILQAIPTCGGGALAVADVQDPERLIQRLREAAEPVAAFLEARLSAATRTLLLSSPSLSPGAVLPSLIADLNALIAEPSLYAADLFATVHLRPATLARLKVGKGEPDPVLNRMLIEDAFPIELADAALALSDGLAEITRCTVLGPAFVHQLEASECILADAAVVDDLQQGCVRFSAWSAGSVLPRQYESVTITAGAPLFTATDFGQPGYAQLLAEADDAILPATTTPTVPTILRGAQNGSEMGAFAADGNPIKERGLLVKYQEFMPIGLVPTLVYVT